MEEGEFEEDFEEDEEETKKEDTVSSQAQLDEKIKENEKLIALTNDLKSKLVRVSKMLDSKLHSKGVPIRRAKRRNRSARGGNLETRNLYKQLEQYKLQNQSLRKKLKAFGNIEMLNDFKNVVLEKDHKIDGLVSENKSLKNIQRQQSKRLSRIDSSNDKILKRLIHENRSYYEQIQKLKRGQVEGRRKEKKLQERVIELESQKSRVDQLLSKKKLSVGILRQIDDLKSQNKRLKKTNEENGRHVGILTHSNDQMGDRILKLKGELRRLRKKLKGENEEKNRRFPKSSNSIINSGKKKKRRRRKRRETESSNEESPRVHQERSSKSLVADSQESTPMKMKDPRNDIVEAKTPESVKSSFKFDEDFVMDKSMSLDASVEIEKSEERESVVESTKIEEKTEPEPEPEPELVVEKKVPVKVKEEKKVVKEVEKEEEVVVEMEVEKVEEKEEEIEEKQQGEGEVEKEGEEEGEDYEVNEVSVGGEPVEEDEGEVNEVSVGETTGEEKHFVDADESDITKSILEDEDDPEPSSGGEAPSVFKPF